MTVGQWKNALLNNGKYMTFGASGGFLRTPKNPPWLRACNRPHLCIVLRCGIVLVMCIGLHRHCRRLHQSSIIVVVVLTIFQWHRTVARLDPRKTVKQGRSDGDISVYIPQNQSLKISSRPSDHYFRSVCLFVCLPVQSFSQPSDPILIKLGHMLYVWV